MLAFFPYGLVDTLEGRDGLTLVFVEGRADNAAVCKVDLAVRGLLIAEGVLHPVGVVSVGEVLPGVRTTGLLPCGGGGGGLGTVGVPCQLLLRLWEFF